MIPKSGYRFLEKIMLKKQAKAKCRFNQKSFALGHDPEKLASGDKRLQRPAPGAAADTSDKTAQQ
jgi:hypothetical protein